MKKLMKFSWMLVLPMIAAAAIVWNASATPDGECPEVDPPTGTILIPDLEDCRNFYSCSNGVKILMHCPDGLWYNPNMEVCDWPFAVAHQSDCKVPPGTEPIYMCYSTIKAREGAVTLFCGTCDFVANSAPVDINGFWGCSKK